MDYLEFNEKNLIILSHNDCLDMAFLGYECFNLFFTEEDWNSISQLPEELAFFHSNPSACKFIKVATKKSTPYDKRYMKLISMLKTHELEMLENDSVFPDDWEFDVITYE